MLVLISDSGELLLWSLNDVTSCTLSLLRLDAKAVSMSVEIFVKNKNRVTVEPTGPGTTPLTAEQKAEWHFLRPTEQAPAVFSEPAVSAGIFFSEVEVLVDGNPIPSRLGTHGYIYSTFKRHFVLKS